MSLYKRRHFLQFAGSSIATLGLGQLSVKSQGLFDTKAVAQTTPRKLALLVGINQYSNGIPKLQGCVNDVLMQKELLTYRFGFSPQDILTLTNEQATRKGILKTFEEHLIKQAKPGDIVVFHFSGFGSQVIDTDKDNLDGLVSSLLPVDTSAPSEKSSNVTQDITGHTLWLLMTALNTENVTFVIDTNSSGGLFNNSLKAAAKEYQPSPEEKSYQQTWLKRLGLSQAEFLQRRRKGIPKGVVLAASKRDQLIVDARFNGFSAGALSYEFTQYLWQNASQPLSQVFTNVAQKAKADGIKAGIPQDAVMFVKPGSENENLPTYFIKLQAPGGDGVITSIQGNDITIWLGGASSEQLDTFSKRSGGAVLEIIDTEGKKLGQLQLESRQGLIGSAKLIQSQSSALLKPGLLLKGKT